MRLYTHTHTSSLTKQKGITLIALVITIIVLLILAGISIAMITGENGILTKATTAQEETKKAQYKEGLELIGLGLRPEQVMEQLSSKDFMDRYEEKIQEEIDKEDVFKGATKNRKDDNTILVTTEEGWIYKVTEDEVILLGSREEYPEPPDLTKGNIDFVYTPTTWTRGSVKVEIRNQVEGCTLQYSRDANTWEDYNSNTGIVMTQNGVIYARFKNNLDEIGGYGTAEIGNIDRNAPIGSVSATKTKDSITINVNASDVAKTNTDGCSGIKGYYYSNNNGSSYSDITTNRTYTFSGLQSETTYNIKVLVVDNANNQLPLTISVKTDSKYLYIVRNGVINDEVAPENKCFTWGAGYTWVDRIRRRSSFSVQIRGMV